MRVAVTGASGFIGRHVVRSLRARGVVVVAASRRPHTSDDPGVLPLALDIDDPPERVMSQLGSPGALIHLAWGGLPNYQSAHHVAQQLPSHSAFLDACLAGGLQRLLVAGTCLEYGLQSGQLEESMPARPTTAYGEAKHRLHEHLLARQAGNHFALGWLRLFYLFGPGQADSSLYSSLQAAARSQADAFDMSTGDQVRDFLPVESAAEHIVSLALGHDDPGTVNICSGRGVPVLETVQDWLRGWHSDLHLNRGALPYPDYEAFAFWGSRRRLDTLLGTR